MLVCETVRLDPGKRQVVEYRLLGDRVSRLWNAANYVCRQCFLAKEGVPVGSALEKRMKDSPDYRQLPSDIAQIGSYVPLEEWLRGQPDFPLWPPLAERRLSENVGQD